MCEERDLYCKIGCSVVEWCVGDGNWLKFLWNSFMGSVKEWEIWCLVGCYVSCGLSLINYCGRG